MTVVLNGVFDLDVSQRDSFILSNEIAGSVAIRAGGYKLDSGPVTEPDELGRPVAVPGKFYISVGVPEIIAKFHEIAPVEALNGLFSLENQKDYGMTNFTVSFGKFGEDKEMDNQMIAYFNMDRNCAHYKAMGERQVVKETVGATLASATGGYVSNFGRVGSSGKCFVILNVSETAVKDFEAAPEAFTESVFSKEKQNEFGILGLTIRLRRE